MIVYVVVLLLPHPQLELFPYTTLFRSRRRVLLRLQAGDPVLQVTGPGPGALEVVLQVEDLADTREVDALVLTQLLEDRKSTRLNSSHVAISYAVFCLKEKKEMLIVSEK